MESSASLLPRAMGGDGSTSSEAAQQAAFLAEMYSLNCQAGFIVVGLQDGEAVCTPIRVICTLITISVGSSWFTRRKSIKMLLLFFSHWLSGLLHQLASTAEAVMISVCWTGADLVGIIKAFKFLELASSNMLAITNLAICINLALIVMSHRTLSFIKSASSPPLILLSLAISIAAAAASAPFWDITVVSGTTFWLVSDDKREEDWIVISMFFIEFIVGICMFVIVSWLLLFRMKEVKECWKLHARIRYYFGLTLIGTAVNLALGICGTLYVFRDLQGQLLIVLTWTFRYIHIALDTIVLYGVLGTRYVDERAGSPSARPTAPREAQTVGPAAEPARPGAIAREWRKLSSRRLMMGPRRFCHHLPFSGDSDPDHDHDHDDDDDQDRGRKESNPKAVGPLDVMDVYSSPPCAGIVEKV